MCVFYKWGGTRYKNTLKLRKIVDKFIGFAFSL